MPRTLAVAVVTNSPDEPAAGDASLIQLLLSLSVNLLDASTSKLLLVPSCSAVDQRLRVALGMHSEISALGIHTVVLGDVLRKVSPQLTLDIDRIPEMIKAWMITASQARAAASPGKEKPWDERLSVYDVGRYFSLYRTIHQAAAVRFAMTQMDASAVLVLKPNSYLWKPLHLSDLIPRQRDVWFADQWAATSSLAPHTTPVSPPCAEWVAHTPPPTLTTLRLREHALATDRSFAAPPQPWP